MENSFNKKSGKLTLRGYYDGLPASENPKTKFINEVISRTGVSANTVRNWVRYGMKPTDPANVKILAEITGIPEEDLWEA